jgi:hypothetical protein
MNNEQLTMNNEVPGDSLQLAVYSQGTINNEQWAISNRTLNSE